MSPPPEPEFFEPTMLRGIRPGNMAFGQGCIVVAGADELVAYVPQKHLLRGQRKVLDAPATLPALYELAMAQTDAGLTAEAANAWRRLRETGDKKWREVSDERSAAMRGTLKNPWEIKCVARKRAERFVETGSDRQALDLPLRNTLEIPARIFQDLDCPREDHPSLMLGVRGDELFCLDASAQQIRWTQSLPPDESTLWLGVCGGMGLHAALIAWKESISRMGVNVGPRRFRSARLRVMPFAMGRRGDLTIPFPGTF